MSKILIVEDEADMAEVITERLRGENFEVMVASEGYRGIELAHKKKPDLIILDLMIPVGDGLWVLKTLRQDPDTGRIPVVVLTGISDDDYKQKILDEGVDVYMEKPYDGDQLVAAVNKLLGSK
jgi:DNA-binding response OmpR family regulator